MNFTLQQSLKKYEFLYKKITSDTAKQNEMSTTLQIKRILGNNDISNRASIFYFINIEEERIILFFGSA